MKAFVILSVIANVYWVGNGRKLARVIGIQLYVLFVRTVTASLEFGFRSGKPAGKLS